MRSKNAVSVRYPSLRQRLALPGLLALLSLSPALAQAQIVMTFEGLRDTELVQNFYNGGVGSLGSSGANLGVEFLGNTMAYIQATQGGSGFFSNVPTPYTTITFQNPSSSAVLNVAAGFSGGFSFYYSSNVMSDVIVYDGPNATGNVLATIPIVAQRQNGCNDSNYCNWTAAGGAFSGTAYSVSFGGTANQTGYDNITLGSATPGGGTRQAHVAVPTLGAAGLGLLAALAAALGMRSQSRRRQRQ